MNKFVSIAVVAMAVAFQAHAATSDPMFLNLSPDRTAFWRTATNASFTVSWTRPWGAGSATVTVVGATGEERKYENLTGESLEISLPVPDSEKAETVYSVGLAFDSAPDIVKVVRIAVLRETSRLRFPGTKNWDAADSSAVLPVPYGATSLTIDNETVDTGLGGAAGWYAWNGIDEGPETHVLGLTLPDGDLLAEVRYAPTPGLLLILR